MKETITIIHNTSNNSKKAATHNPNNSIVKSNTGKQSAPFSVKRMLQSLGHALQWKQLKQQLQPAALLVTARRYWYGLAAASLLLLLLVRNGNFQNGNNTERQGNVQQASLLLGSESGSSSKNEHTLKTARTKNENAQPKAMMAGMKEDAAEENYSLPQIPELKRPEKAIMRELGRHAQKVRDEYIQRFLGLAKNEQERYNIPSSISLGLAILNSDFGNSPVAKEGYNHLGMRCSDNPIPMGKGMTGQGVHGGVCYTRYESAWAGFRAHSQFIAKYFPKALDKAGNSYAKWVKELDKAGYFSGRKFGAAALLQTIETYQLSQFDSL